MTIENIQEAGDMMEYLVFENKHVYLSRHQSFSMLMKLPTGIDLYCYDEDELPDEFPYERLEIQEFEDYVFDRLTEDGMVALLFDEMTTIVHNRDIGGVLAQLYREIEILDDIPRNGEYIQISMGRFISEVNDFGI